ncbi:hypothetical protein Indivirus_7_3 [Indivirus ILV1]|uniref:Uncharacterized protein n=1 Tax=Indivirus ILV1 TaxID=1977633 RepID=A0A1V0SE41_9VIRU|nr:hypothetical protein Indivirus_7_3 [Indivirus ILV1]
MDIDIQDSQEQCHYYLILSEGNEFPSWFKMHQKGILKISLNQPQKDLYKYDFMNPDTKKGKFVGKDDKFKYYLEDISFTKRAILNDQFFMTMNVSIDVNPTFLKKYPPEIQLFYIKRVKLTYEIYAPIFQ